jgi:nuclear transport factor 2 (NTF2) superfamily protein
MSPFDEETPRAKVKAAQYAWNSKNHELVAHAYAADSRWRDLREFFAGRQALVEFLKRKWYKELDYHPMKELWCYTGNRISVRFEYEWKDTDTR